MAFCGFLGPVCSIITITMVPLMLGALVSGNPPRRLTAPGLLSSPVALRLDSVDYKNVLHWAPPLSNTTLTYSVQWKIYGESVWVEVQGCQEIRGLQCDLSTVTSRPRDWYYARVHASSLLPASHSAWALSRRFSPRWDTTISPPTLNLTITDQGVVVHLKPSAALVQKLQKRLCCRIQLRHGSGEEDQYERQSCTKELALAQLSAGTTYCFQAQTVVCLQGKSSSRSPLRCVTTP